MLLLSGMRLSQMNFLTMTDNVTDQVLADDNYCSPRSVCSLFLKSLIMGVKKNHQSISSSAVSVSTLPNFNRICHFHNGHHLPNF